MNVNIEIIKEHLFNKVLEKLLQGRVTIIKEIIFTNDLLYSSHYGSSFEINQIVKWEQI